MFEGVRASLLALQVKLVAGRVIVQSVTGLAPSVATVIRPVGVPPGYGWFKVTVKSTLDSLPKDTDDGDTVSKMLVVAWSTVSD